MINDKKLSMRIGADQIETLNRIAKAQDRSLSAIIRIAINEYIKKQTNKPSN